MLQGCRWIIALALVAASGLALADDDEYRQDLPLLQLAQTGDEDEPDDDDVEEAIEQARSQTAVDLSGGGLYQTPTGISTFQPAAPRIVPPPPPPNYGPTPWSFDNEQPFIQRFGVSHVGGDGLGFDNGFTTLEFMTPMRGDLVWDNLFGDARIFMHNDATVGGNFGVGYRHYNLAQNRIWGLNAYYDYRQTDFNDFNQAGVGFESLGALIDFRANAYIPDVDRIRGYVPGKFINHLLITNRDEIAMTGGDAEAGICLFDFDQVQGRVYGGGYYFYGHGNDDATGWKARAELAAADQQFWVNASVQQDQVFGTTFNVGVSISYLRRAGAPTRAAMKPMDHIFYRRPGDAAAANIAHRLSAPVQRLQNIVLSQQPEIARDAAGVPINFLHVVNGGAGDGTFENPYGTLTDAMNDAAAGTSIIYTPRGGAFVENLTFVPGAQVLSNGPRQYIPTQFGRSRLPFSGASRDLMNLPTLMGDVDMADDTRFSGFEVTGQITGTSISNVTLDHNVIENVGDAIVFSDVDGAVLDTLFVESSAGIGIVLDDTSATLTDVTVNFAADDGIQITTGATDRTVDITNLTVMGAAAQGLDVSVDGAGSLDLSLHGTNSITSSGDAFAAALGGASSGDLIISLENTTFASTSGTAINVDGSAGAGTIYLTRLLGLSITEAATGGFLVDTATFDADPTTGAIDAVNVSMFPIGASGTGNNITGDGLSLIDPTGELNITTLTIFNDMGTGLLVDTKGGGTTFSLTTGPLSTITTTNGAAMSLDPLDVDLQFDTVSSTDSPTNGIFIDTVSGRIQIGTTTLTDPVMTAIVIQNTPAPLDIHFGTTTISSLISDAFADNVDTTTGNGTNLMIDFDSLTITGP